jgi:hypothetical protein
MEWNGIKESAGDQPPLLSKKEKKIKKWKK